MGKVVEKTKKKKGRPSLLDLQKRTLKEQQQQQQQQQLKRHNNPAPNSDLNYRTAPNSLRRSARRNPNPDDADSPEKLHDDDDEDEELSTGKRREKKLKLVLKLPSQRSSFNSASSNSCGSDTVNLEDDNVASNNKKRKITAIRDGSVSADADKGDKYITGINATKTPHGTQQDSGPSTPLPDKKLLLFILDRLQKKDTYGVFSEPVDPSELPDYHEVIEHPMDFGTVKKKLEGGAYVNLEQFEGDVFLICTNAMQYNSPDTIYFRQARSIQELAKKNFENLRQDSDGNEPEPRIVRRGRPPTKNLKKTQIKNSSERAGSEFSSDATLPVGGENAMWSNYDTRKGPHNLQKSAFADLSGQSHVARNNDFCSSWSAENKSEKIDDFTGSPFKGNTTKYTKKQFVLDENRRNTYQQFLPSATGREPSVLTTFDGERKLLLPVGLHSEYGYARSLAQFAAHLGPVAWKIASKKIERCLPQGIKFGPGWVGENDVTQPIPMPRPSPASVVSLPLQCLGGQSSVSSVVGPVEPKHEKSSEKSEGNISSEKHAPSTHLPLEGHPSNPISPCFNPTSSSFVLNRSFERNAEKAEVNRGSNSPMGSNLENSSINATRPMVNGFNVASHMGKLRGASQPGGFNMDSSSMLDTSSRSSNNLSHSAPANSIKSDDAKIPENSNTKSSSTLANNKNESLLKSMPGLHSPAYWQPYQKSIPGLPSQQKPDPIPPDLNIRFQAPGSPNSNRVDSTPDLALQL